MMCMRLVYLFFFQAEDGIRDVAVTGVQTCALPISSPKTLQSRQSRDRYGGRMLKRHVGRLRDHFGVSSARVFGKGPACASENFVARSELRYLAANRFHLAGQVHAESWILWFAEPGLHAKGIGHAPHEVPVIGIQIGRASCRERV